MSRRKQKLRADQRIRTAKDFELIFKKGNHRKGKSINVWIYGDGDKQPPAIFARPRFGVVVSKKVDRRASRRNLWKRRIREAWRMNQRRMPAGMMVLVQAKHAEEPAAFSAIREELDALLSKMGF